MILTSIPHMGMKLPGVGLVPTVIQIVAPKVAIADIMTSMATHGLT